MIPSIHPAYIIYTFAVVFGVASTAYFAKDILLSLSHTVKLASMYSLSLALFLGSSITTQTISIVLIILSLSMYSFSTLYIWKTYGLSRIHKFTLLSLSTVLLIIVGYGFQIGYLTSIPRHIVLTSYGFNTLILSVLIPTDIMEDEPITYEFDIRNNIKFDTNKKKVGTIIIKNEGMFTRKFQIPVIKCVYDSKNEEVKIRTSTTSTDGNALKTIKSDTITLDIIANVNHIRKDERFSHISLSSEFNLDYKKPENVKEDVHIIELKRKSN